MDNTLLKSVVIILLATFLIILFGIWELDWFIKKRKIIKEELRRLEMYFIQILGPLSVSLVVVGVSNLLGQEGWVIPLGIGIGILAFLVTLHYWIQRYEAS